MANRALFAIKMGHPQAVYITSLMSGPDYDEANTLARKVIGDSYFEVMEAENTYSDIKDAVFISARTKEIYVHDYHTTFKPKYDDKH